MTPDSGENATGLRRQDADIGPARRKPSRVRLTWVAGLLATGLAVFLAGFAAFVGSLQYDERDPATRTDGIVALTGGAQRIEDAIELLAKGFAKRLLISGVNERTGRDVIERLSVGQRALVQCCVDLGYEARDTVGNAAEISDWARGHGYRSLIVVTSNYHLPRTLTELDFALPEIRKIPYAVVATRTGTESWRASASRARLLLSEYAKFVAVWVRTRRPNGSRQVA